MRPETIKERLDRIEQEEWWKGYHLVMKIYLIIGVPIALGAIGYFAWAMWALY